MVRKLLLIAALLAWSAGAQAQTMMQFPTTPWEGFAPKTVQCGTLLGANANITTDQAIPISVPSANYMISEVIVSNPNNAGTLVSMTTASGGLYSAVSKGGVAIAANQALSPLTTNAQNATGNAMLLTLATAGNTTSFGGNAQGANATQTLYFSLTTAQGAASTVDVRVACRLMY